ncbi:MAG: hypothetical protein KAR40_09925 [Candidatus Sabulitectum sp.]|nr:hypothetical protein [Candidatus Sabulitectum sp.]
MSDSRMKILEMLSEGKITADEASSLLEKVSTSRNTTAESMEKTVTDHTSPRYLRVVVDSADGDKVNVKIPMSLIKTGIKLSALMPSDAAEAMKDQGIDLTMLRDLPTDELIEALRELEVNVDSADGDTVRVFTE